MTDIRAERAEQAGATSCNTCCAALPGGVITTPNKVAGDLMRGRHTTYGSIFRWTNRQTFFSSTARKRQGVIDAARFDVLATANDSRTGNVFCT